MYVSSDIIELTLMLQTNYLIHKDNEQGYCPKCDQIVTLAKILEQYELEDEEDQNKEKTKQEDGVQVTFQNDANNQFDKQQEIDEEEIFKELGYTTNEFVDG